MPKKTLKSKRKKWRIAPCGLRHDMDPFFMGLAAAEFTPADPAAWFDAACAERLTFARSGDRIIISKQREAAKDFLTGQLIGTPGGQEALSAWMAARGFEVIKNGA
jgi:hypothetical protein